MWIYGLPKGFEKLGHKVKTCNPSKKTEQLIKQFKPTLIMAIGWTPANSTPSKQRLIAKLVKMSGAPFVYWSTEDPGYTEDFSLPLIRRTKPNFVFTIHRPTVHKFRNKSLHAAHLDFGSDPATHRRLKSVKKYKGEAAVVANAYPQLYIQKPGHYRFKSLRKLVHPFLKAGVHVDFYGRNWGRMKKMFNANVPKSWTHGYLPYKDAIKVYNSVKFVIGPQNAEDRLTQRTYEVMASGGLLITDDTPEVRKWFKPGRELLVSNSAQETKKLIVKYMKNPRLREKIRANAVKAAARHTYQKRAAYVIKTLRKHGII
ncbi:glycosyltransferase [Paenibacillus sp. CCS19]|uniref:CgeB family protein n=1 Tax=Paenibacillus sp. CCS19 TaxID=3158387 RepID=UPI00295EA1AF|nr:glycosyltransferase [Paenibacillus cellulosilyticus]